MKREKLERYKSVCSEVVPKFLYVSGAEVATDLDQLQKHGITHVVNCAAQIVPSPHNLRYMLLNMRDDGLAEDMCWTMYAVFDFVEAAWDAGGRVLVHCVSGVSRSCGLAIAFLMHRGAGFGESYATVRLCRPVCEPNSGFQSQLMAWDERRRAIVDKRAAFVYRAVYRHRGDCASKLCVETTDYGSPLPPLPSTLDRRGAFVVLRDGSLTVWVGEACDEALRSCAIQTAVWLGAYDGAPSEFSIISQADRLLFDNNYDGEIGQVREYDEDYEPSLRSSAPTDDVISTPLEEVPVAAELPARRPSVVRLYELASESDDDAPVSAGYQWELVSDYDHGDLDSSRLLLLVAESEAGVRRVSAWVGSKCVFVADPQAGAATTGAEEDVRAFLRTITLPSATAQHAAPCVSQSGDLAVVWEGSEPDAFWAEFERGF
ncbi:hypothetical protein CTAYLR_004714 [Chrysophaeum taylorii]|uniref:Dual specificity protein phosphatase n=1 Tax=Chrysophaeum taylorii TaxID=2483200 RepID=A0AAD7XIJ4_9STRA|nr:hypothetical protein CTAYLR_004714 [Chrysophaeum taylorii]